MHSPVDDNNYYYCYYSYYYCYHHHHHHRRSRCCSCCCCCCCWCCYYYYYYCYYYYFYYHHHQHQTCIPLSWQNTSEPELLENLLWNCSVPFWPNFYLHLFCNRRVECPLWEDERVCPYTLCQNGGRLHLKSKEIPRMFVFLTSMYTYMHKCMYACLHEHI